MLLDENELKERLDSPLNLLNRLKKATNPHKIVPPALPPKSEDIIEDLEDKISNGSIKTRALGLMTAAMDELKQRMPEVQKPEKLASIAAEMSKILSNTDQKNRDGDKPTAQIIIYAPRIMSEDDFDIIDISGEAS